MARRPSAPERVEFAHSHRFDAPPDAIWEALRSPAMLRACIDGCDAASRHGAEFALTVRMPLGALRATARIRARVQLAEQPTRATLVFHADDARAGAARGRIDVVLEAHGAATHVDMRLGASLSGPVAQLTARALNIGLQQIAADFCNELEALLRAQSGRGANRARPAGSGVRAVPRARAYDPVRPGTARAPAPGVLPARRRDVGQAADAAGYRDREDVRGRRQRATLSGMRTATWGLVAVLAAVCYWALRLRYWRP